MKRKTYEKKLRAMLAAIYHHPESNFVNSYSLGQGMKYSMSHAREGAKNFGSYEAAWNNDAMRWAREFYLGEVL